MKHIKKRLGILVAIYICTAGTQLIAREQPQRKIVRSISEYPNRAAQASLDCTQKATVLAIETQVAQANVLFKEGRYQEAIENYLHAIEMQPDHSDAHYNLGLAYLAVHNYTQAKKSIKQALEIQPDHLLAHYFLGYISQVKQEFSEAIDHYEEVIKRDPHHFNAHLNKGRSFANINQLEHAITSYEKALNLQPLDVNANFEVGYLYNRVGNLESSIRHYQYVVDNDPTRTEGVCNLAHALRYAGKMEQAIPFYQKTLEQDPTNAHAHCGLAECYLATGNLIDGFHHFGYRFDRTQDTRSMRSKRWDGVSDLTGKTVLVRAEFGQGDSIQFARYLPLLKQKGAYVILEVQHTLVQLFSKAPYIDEVIAVSDPVGPLPSFDYQIPMMSLPEVFGTTVESIPHISPYIYTDENLDEYWKQQLKEDTNFRIGICWQGSTYYEQFKSPYSKKSIPLTMFIPITKLIGASVYSFQKMNGTEELQQLPSDVYIHDFGPSFDHDNGRFMDTASALKQMNLVITTDTSVAHLAGALGIKTWVILPYVADWRWLLDQDNSPWYPNMRLFRQPAPHDWQGAFDMVMHALEKILFDDKQPLQEVQPSAPLAMGDLIDKMTILEIKLERIQDKKQLKNILNEASLLKEVFDTHINKDQRSKKLFGLMRELKSTNETLWDIEDSIRSKEAKKSFDNEFIELARGVYFTNDKRGQLKRAINELLGSRLVEEKRYSDY